MHIIRRVSVCNSESDVHKARLVNCMILGKIEIYLENSTKQKKSKVCKSFGTVQDNRLNSGPLNLLF